MNLETLRLLVSKGLSADDILEVAESLKVRSSNAERQARYRDKQRNARNVTRNVTPNPDKETPPIPPKEINPSTPVVSNETTPPAPILNLVSDNPDHGKPKLQPSHVSEAWNAMCDRCGLPKVRTIEGARDRKLRTLIRKHPIEEFTEAIDAVERARWMHGENARGWRVNFKFFLDHFTEFLEGTYDKSAA